MLVIISDIHFGQGPAVAERAKERALLELLHGHRDELEALYLLGDVFDQFVEYRHLLPKGFARFQGRLAELTDAGVPVHYLVGNHDPWHLDYFEKELGVALHRSGFALTVDGRSLTLSHGDTAGESGVSHWARGLFRHRASAALFRTLIPADAAYRLTRWTKTTFGSDPLDPETDRQLALTAKRQLERGSDVVIMGHSHVPRCLEHAGGIYVNAGSWHIDRCYVTVDASSIAVRRWNGEDFFVYAFDNAEIDRSGD